MRLSNSFFSGFRRNLLFSLLLVCVLAMASATPVSGTDIANARLSQIVVTWGTDGERILYPDGGAMSCIVPNDVDEVTIEFVPVEYGTSCTVVKLETISGGETPSINRDHIAYIELQGSHQPVILDLSVGTTQYDIETYAANDTDTDEQKYALLITRAPEVDISRPDLNDQPYIVFTGSFTAINYGEQLGQYPPGYYDQDQ